MPRMLHRKEFPVTAMALIGAVKHAKDDRWQNYTICLGDQIFLEYIAQHYESCPDCARAFDILQYYARDLEDFVQYLQYPRDKIQHWTCIGKLGIPDPTQTDV